MSLPPGGPHGGSFDSAVGFTAGRHQFYQSSMIPSSAASSSVMSENFTPQMRDRQARGKDPYHSGDGSEDGDLSDRESKLRLGCGRVEKEDFARVELRQKAIAFLDNPELLTMYAQSTGNSIPGARLHWTKVLCGFDTDEQQAHASKHSTSSHPRQGDDQRYHRPADKRGGRSDNHRSGAN
ncbi:hypothetical protein MMYC01_200728 [Madurella mycetomatis]|uniref:Uncharacterized protein n=1 Tax=Madurella mycetomatis TaxID=100816 RepID=A0A175WGX4_9PEZI|nr:hypothetical protein MMYC01_200728 [Madurella mycetomatis]